MRAGRVGTIVQAYNSKPIPYRHRVAERIAYILLSLLGGTILVHYLGTAILLACFREKYGTVAAEFDKIFNNLLPILSGLVGSAVTFYFTRETRGS